MILMICVPSVFTKAYAQTKIKHPHCNCEDVITKIEPNLDGDFQRSCNGIVLIEGKFNNGEKDGLWITKSKNGNVIRKFIYKNGVIDGKVEVYYSSGAPKLAGEFKNGKKEGSWVYYNEKGKIIKAGKFENGVPVGVWKLFDLKGKKELVVYDFEKSKYIIKRDEQSLFEPAQVLQNDNSAEWWIRHTHDSDNSKFLSKPFEGYRLTSDMHVLLMEIPLEIWETYLSYKLQANLKFDGKVLTDIEVIFVEGHVDKVPEIGLFATTNEASKLTDLNHQKITKQLLTHNLEEAIWLMGPWINNDKELKIYLPYVINKFQNSPFK